MKNIEDKYEILRGTATDEELLEYQKCFSENGTNKELEVLKWFHRKNVQKDQLILFAKDKNNGGIAAIYTYLPIKLKCLNRVVPALQSFDTLTDEKHRGQGLFAGLESRLAEIAKEKNILVYGFPNENSVNGFVKKMGFTYFGEVPFLIKPLRLNYFFRRLLKRNRRPAFIKIKTPEEKTFKNGSIKRILEFGEDYNKMWAALSDYIPVAVNRDAEYMNWRYFQKPGADYAKYGFYQDGELMGIVVFILEDKHNGNIGYLMELLYYPGNKAIGKRLLKFAEMILKDSKADLILAWCYSHSFNYRSYKSSGYYIFPEKFRPQKLGVIVKELRPIADINVRNVNNWFISYSDSDTV